MRTWGRVVVGVALLAVVFAIANARRTPREASVPVAPTPSVASQPAANAATPTAPNARMVVAFKLDTDLTNGHYLGERWVSPPTFAFAQAGAQYTTHAKLQAIGEDGTRTDLSGEWSTSDPQMIAITRDKPGQVTIVVREEGEAQLVASAGGQRRVLQVRATRTPDAMDVAFAQ